MSTTTLNDKSKEIHVTGQSVPPTPISMHCELEKVLYIQDTGYSVSQTPTLPQDEARDKSAKEGTASFDLERQPTPSPPYHVFTRSYKLQIVYIVSAAAIFSPLSSNIYFPALGMISRVSR